MNRSSKALRMAQPLAVVAVWAGLLGYVIPAAFSAAPTVAATATAASAASHRDAGPLNASAGSSDGTAPNPAVSSQQHHPDPAMVRVMQAAARPRRVSVTLNHQRLSRDQAFASITPYRSVRPGTWIVRASGAGERAATRVTLVAGSRTTLVVLGGHSHLAISVAGDPHGVTTAAAGSAPSPPAVAAPRGGGGSPVPWLVLGGTGLLLTLAGVARIRQLCWARRVAAHIP
jgi:Domain of unknown function (DUF4397)